MVKHNKVMTVSNGTATGKLVFASSWQDVDKISQNSDTPVILLVKNFNNINPSNFPQNIVGLVSTQSNLATLSHQAANIRVATVASAFVGDEKLAEKIEKLENKYVEFTTAEKSLKIKEIDKKDVKPPEIIEYNIKIPKLKPVNKLLTSSEYTKDTVGAKALNLLRLERMREAGKIDAIIPKNFAVPYEYLYKMRDENPRKSNDFKEPDGAQKLSYFEAIKLGGEFPGYNPDAKNSKCAKEIISMIENIGIKGQSVMVRSAFNGEDVENYSAAGLYDSESTGIETEKIYQIVMSVAASKWNPRAAMSRSKYGINHKDIKPTVIIQEKIPADYVFTLYTKDQNDLFKIELASKDGQKRQTFSERFIPYSFTYNRKTGKVKFETKED